MDEGWAETKNRDNFKVIYVKPSKKHDDDIINVLKQKNKIINRYPGAKELSHKDIFAKQMKVCMDMDPEGYDFVPPTFNYPAEEKRLAAYMKKHPNICFIGKPQASAKGNGIFLFRDLKDL